MKRPPNEVRARARLPALAYDARILYSAFSVCLAKLGCPDAAPNTARPPTPAESVATGAYLFRRCLGRTSRATTPSARRASPGNFRGELDSLDEPTRVLQNEEKLLTNINSK